MVMTLVPVQAVALLEEQVGIMPLNTLLPGTHGSQIVNAGETLTIGDGVIISGTVTVNAGGTLYMTGGTITGPGRGVLVSGGTFSMCGGVITENEMLGGGAGVSVTGGIFYMSGDAEIYNNFAIASLEGVGGVPAAGGVYVDGGTFNMHGGTIRYNQVGGVPDTCNHGHGGGVRVRDGGTFNMHSGTIAENRATGRGGGVYVESGSSFIMHGTAPKYIADNTARYMGGGISLTAGNADTFFTMADGAVIRGNGAARGGGICIRKPAQPHTEITWGRTGIAPIYIYDNYTTTGANAGGGIAIYGGTQTIPGNLVIAGNRATYGGGISVASIVLGGNSLANVTIPATVTIGGPDAATIDDINDDECKSTFGNWATYGGGVHVAANARLTVSGGTIQGNHAGSDGGGIFTEVFTYESPLPGPDADDPGWEEHYYNLTVGAAVVFTGNTAGKGAFTPPNNALTHTGITAAAQRSIIPDSEPAEQFRHPLNNYDVNFRGPELDADKTVAGPVASRSVSPGDVLTYTIVVRNDSPVATAHNVQVVDALSDLLPYIAPPGAGTVTIAASDTDHVVLPPTDPAKTVANLIAGITIPRIGPEEYVTLTFTVTVQANLDLRDFHRENPDGELENKVSVYIGDDLKADDDATIPVRHPATLVKTSNAPATGVRVGDTVTYTLTATNPNTFALENFVIVDDLPAGLAFIPGSVTVTPTTAQVGAYAIVDGELRVTVNLPAAVTGETTTPGTVTVSFRARVISAPAEGAPIINTGLLNRPDGTQEDETDETVPVRLPATLEKTSVDTYPWVAAGDIVTYRLTATNPNPFALDGFTIVDDLPAGLAFIPGSVTVTPATAQVGTYAIVDGELHVIVNLPAASATAPGAVVVTFRAEVLPVASGEEIENIGELRRPDGEREDEDEEEIEVRLPATLVKTSNVPADARVAVGDIVEYRLTATNPNEFPLNGFILVDNLPEGLAFVPDSVTVTPATAQVGAYAIVDGALRVIVNLPAASATASGTVVVAFEAKILAEAAGEEIENVGELRRPDNTPEDEDEEEIEVRRPATLEKTSDVAEGTIVRVGDILEYTLTARNPNPFALENFVIVDDLPAGLQFVADSVRINSAAGAYTFVDGVLRVSVNIPAATVVDGDDVYGTVVVTFRAEVLPAAIVGTVIENTGTLYRPDGGREDEDDEEVPVRLPATLEKTSDVPEDTKVQVGDEVTYTLTARNPNPFALDGFTIVDDLPTGLRFVPGSVTVTPATAQVGSYTIGDDGELRVRVNLPAATSATAPGTVVVTFRAEILPAAANTVITNTGTLYNSGGGQEDEDEEEIEEGEVFWRQAFLIGRPSGNIYPQDNITRAEVATIFFRMLEDEVRTDNWTQNNPFNDVQLHQWFNNAISTTVGMGFFRNIPYITGGQFHPQEDITRAELAVILVRFMNLDRIGPFSAAVSDDNQFNDIAGHWARVYINRAAEEGWIRGDEGVGGPFRPDDPLERAEAAAMINRIFQRLVETPACLLDDMVDWPDNDNPNLEEAWYFLYMQMATNSYTYRWRSDSNYYKELIETISPRPWHVLERPDSAPEDILDY